MSEAQEQRIVIEWADYNGLPLFHIPNGGKRDKAEAAHLKRQGVKAGVPDLFLPIPKGRYHGLFIELKVGKNKLSANQARWLKLLEMNGYCAKCCYGSNNAISLIKTYMELGGSNG